MINTKFFEDREHIISISSREKHIRNELKAIAKETGSVLIFDNLGSTFLHFASKQENAKKLMISFPMDEYGYMVRSINEDGYISIVGVSNQTSVNLLGKTMILKTREGIQYEGYTTFKRLDLKESKEEELSIKEEECQVYFGFTSKEEAKSKGVNIGDAVVIKNVFHYLKPLVSARGLDVKTGLYTAYNLAHYLKGKDMGYDVYLGGIVQEKVAYRGSVSATTTIQPDINISLAFESETKAQKVGSGVFVKVFDKTTLPNQEMFYFMKDTTSVHSFSSHYGTSASFIHKSLTGVPSLVIGIHGLNIGLNTMLFHEEDIECLSQVLIKFMDTLTKEKIIKFQGQQEDEE